MLKNIIALSVFALTFAQPTFALDAVMLDQLLAKQDYKELNKQLKNDDPETLSYLRSKYMDWYQPLIADFYAIKFLIPLMHKPENKSNLTKEETFEVASAWSRAKTALFIDRQDCKEFTQEVRYWTENFNIASEPMQSVMGKYPAAMYKFGSESLEWARAKESEAIRSPAVWLCGESNIKPDSDRKNDRKKALDALDTQLQSIRQEAEQHK